MHWYNNAIKFGSTAECYGRSRGARQEQRCITIMISGIDWAGYRRMTSPRETFLEYERTEYKARGVREE